MDGRARKQTLTAVALRVLVPRLALFLAVCVTLACGHALGQGFASGSAAVTGDQTLSVPSWSTADTTEHPECTPAEKWPAGDLAAYVVVQAVRDGVHRKITFDRAWRLNHDDTDVDDVWVLGVCG